MILWLAVLAVVVLAGLAAFQLALAAGAPLGRFAWGGQHEVLPRGLRIGSALSFLLYGVFAVVILSAAGLLSVLPDGFVDVAIRVLAGYFVLGVVLNAISRSRPERMVQIPVALVLAVVTLVLAFG